MAATGLVRQYFPKGQDLGTVTKDKTGRVMEKLNHRPRKRLKYRTPHEAFYKTRVSLSVALGG